MQRDSDWQNSAIRQITPCLSLWRAVGVAERASPEGEHPMLLFTEQGCFVAALTVAKPEASQCPQGVQSLVAFVPLPGSFPWPA